MQTIEAFFYKNILEIQVIDPAIFSTRNRIVYSRTIKIYQGIDNPIHIVTKNQDQKSVDLTGYDVQVDIQDPENALTVNTFTVDFITQNKGLGVFTIPKAVVNALDQRHYEFTVKLIHLSDNKETPLPLLCIGPVTCPFLHAALHKYLLFKFLPVPSRCPP